MLPYKCQYISSSCFVSLIDVYTYIYIYIYIYILPQPDGMYCCTAYII